MRLRSWLTTGLMAAGLVQYAWAGDMDLLLQKLVDKGVLSDGEAQQILSETKEEMQKQVQSGIKDTAPWLANMTPKGDMRVRYQYYYHKPRTGAGDRSGQDLLRFRLRYGLDYKVNDMTLMGFRFATGNNSNQTSTNQNFGLSSDKKMLWVDKAFITFTPIKDYLSIDLGKVDNPYFCTDMTWDSDINPEGVYLRSVVPVNDNLKLWATLGYMPIGQQLNRNNPYIVAPQVGVNANVGPVPVKLGVAYYDFHRLKNNPNAVYSPTVGDISANHTANFTNSFTSVAAGTARWVYDYKVWDFNLDVQPYTFTWGDKDIPIGVYGDYLNNAASSVKQHTAWLAGLRVGNNKNKGDWQLNYNYRNLAADATPCIFSDSDFNLGGTNGKGSKIALSYVFLKNATATATYFVTEDIKPLNEINNYAGVFNQRVKKDLLQLDCVVKF